MTYTAKIIKSSLLALLIGTVIGQLFCLAVGEGINAVTVGLSALIAGAIIAVGQFLTSLVLLVTQKEVEHVVNPSGKVLDEAIESKTVLISPAQRAGSFALSGLLILLIGGSACLGGLAVSS